jgi:acetylornithine deacetylase/succinyl-diaminopimelate desuccinylase-like protein
MEQAVTDGRRKRLIADASHLIALRTANPPGDERVAADWVARRLAAAADEVRVDDLGDGRANVLAAIDLGPGPTFLLCTHLDVVPPGSEAQWQPRVAEGRLHGRGSCDAKGPLAAMIAAFESLAARRVGLAGRLLLAAVADEETGALGARALVAGGMRADAAVIGEPTENVAVLASRGALRVAVTFLGRSAHASRPRNGVNAVHAAASLIVALEALDRELEGRGTDGSCAATVVAGGTKLNIVPDRCTVQADRRLGPTEAMPDALAEIERLVAAVVDERPGLDSRIEPAGVWLDPFGLDPGAGFGARLLAALGQPVPGPTFAGGTDAPHLIAAGIPTAILGPGSMGVAHTDDEFVPIESLERAADQYERVARTLLGDDT